MRITELFSGFGYGGAEIAALRRTAFAPIGTHTTILVAGSHDGSFVSDYTPRGAQLTISVCGTGLLEKVRAIEESRPDVVVLNTPRDAIALLASGPRRLAIPTVVAAHSEVLSDRLVLSRPLAVAMRLANRRADLNIAVSRRVAEGPWCRGARHVVVCHLGGDLQGVAETASGSWPNGTGVRLLTLSRLSQPKNLDALLHAISRQAGHLRDVKAHVRMVGDGTERAALTGLISKLGISDLASLAGSAKSSKSWLMSADWLLIPSVAEGGPLTLYEGLQAGLPIMSTPRGAAPDALAGDEESVLARGTDVTALSRALFQVIERPRLTDERRALRAARSAMWSTKACSANWYSTLNSLTSRARPND